MMLRMMVFDSKLWAGKDIGDNHQFWKEAEILSLSGNGDDQIATVRFRYDNRISGGHYTNCMKHICEGGRI